LWLLGTSPIALPIRIVIFASNGLYSNGSILRVHELGILNPLGV
jgi:hypothetical protein